MHYDAFISYKHAEHDIKVAEAVQHGLEHFHIPRKLQKKYGLKRIQRIFRDKDELPITSDLSDEIENALYNADYLIVICSPEAKKSIWVNREIEFFLRNHTKREIFTVVAEGDPMEVVPEVLLTGERTIINEMGMEQTITVNVEPLSCDYRGSLKKAKKEELPRLASGIIGCTYDELMNRRRQYKMRRMSIIFTGILLLALVFGGYMYLSKKEIHRNYLNSLRNQSRYLANESMRVLNNEQRILALQLALAALPDKNSERPVTAEAVRALTSASLAYVTINGTNIDSVWNYRLPNAISDFLISPDGTTLAARDSGNSLTVWDTRTHEAVLELSDPTTSICGMVYPSADTLLVWSSEKLSSYNLTTRETNWTYTISDQQFLSKEPTLTTDNCILIPTTGQSIARFGIDKGNLVTIYKIPQENDKGSVSIIDLQLSPDEKKIAYTAFDSDTKYIMATSDLETSQCLYSNAFDLRIRDICWVDNDRIVIAAAPDNFSSSSMQSGTSYLNKDHTTIMCLDAKTFTKKWEHDLVSTEVILSSGFLPIPQDNQVAYYCGNIAEIYDLDTGVCYYSHNVNSSIINMSDRDGDGWPLYITNDGKLATPSPSFGENAVAAVTEFTDNIDNAQISSGVYVHQKFSNELIYYGLYVCDDEWTEMEGDVTVESIFKNFYLCDEVLAIVSDGIEKRELFLIDPNNNKLFTTVELKNDMLSSLYNILGCYDDYLYIVQTINAQLVLSKVNIHTGEFDNSVISDQAYLSQNRCTFNEDKLIYIRDDGDHKYSLVMYDVRSGKSKDYPIDIASSNLPTVPIYMPDCGSFLYIGFDKEMLIDDKSGKTTEYELPYNWERTIFADYSTKTELYYLTDGAQIAAIDKKGTLKYSFTCPGTTPLGILCFDDMILVPYTNGTLYRYNAENGEFIGRSDLTTYLTIVDEATFQYDKDSHTLYIQMLNMTDIVDTESWVETACIDSCFGHHIPTDRFYTYTSNSKEGHRVGYFKHYTVVELIEKGNKLLGGCEMTDEEKSQYGIDD